MSIEKLISKDTIKTKFHEILSLQKIQKTSFKETKLQKQIKKNNEKSNDYYYGFEFLMKKIRIHNPYFFPIPYLAVFVIISAFSFALGITDFPHLLHYVIPWFVLFVVVLYGGIFYRIQYFRSFKAMRKRNIIDSTTLEHLTENLSSVWIFILFLNLLTIIPLIAVYSNSFTVNPLDTLLERPPEFYSLVIMFPIVAQIFSSLIKGSLLPWMIKKSKFKVDLFHEDNYAGLRTLVDISGLPIFIFITAIAVSFYSTVQADRLSDTSELLLFYFQLGLLILGFLLFSLSQIRIRDIIVTQKNNFLENISFDYKDLYEKLKIISKNNKLDDTDYAELSKRESVMSLTKEIQNKVEKVKACPFSVTRIRFLASFVFAGFSIISTNTELLPIPNISELENLLDIVINFIQE